MMYLTAPSKYLRLLYTEEWPDIHRYVREPKPFAQSSQSSSDQQHGERRCCSLQNGTQCKDDGPYHDNAKLPISIGQLSCEECGDSTHQHEEGYDEAPHSGCRSTDIKLEVWHRCHGTDRSCIIAREWSSCFLTDFFLRMLYPFSKPPIEMMEAASIHPGGLDGFHIASL